MVDTVAATPVTTPTTAPAAAETPAKPAEQTRTGANPTTEVASSTTTESGIAMNGRLNEMNEAELQALLKEIDQMQAVPVTEPEPVMLPVSVSRPARSGGAL